jgi:hypothetical protein
MSPPKSTFALIKESKIESCGNSQVYKAPVSQTPHHPNA